MSLAELAVERGAAQKPGELELLLELVGERELELRAVVELGTLAGGTFWLWAQIAAADALLVSVDLPGGPFAGDVRAATPGELRGMGRAGQRVAVIRGDSHDAGVRMAVERELAGAAVDLLFIDADHSYAGVVADLELYRGLVRSGGLIVLHDVCEHAPELGVGVRRLWLELAGDERLELVTPPTTWGGIGVLIAP